MDWFTRITGLEEATYASTKAQLEMHRSTSFQCQSPQLIVDDGEHAEATAIGESDGDEVYLCLLSAAP